MHEHERVLQAGSQRDRIVTGQKPATAGAKFRIPLGRYNAADQLGGGPDAAGILPAPAASPQPFPQNRPGGNQPAFRFLKRA